MGVVGKPMDVAASEARFPFFSKTGRDEPAGKFKCKLSQSLALSKPSTHVQRLTDGDSSLEGAGTAWLLGVKETTRFDKFDQVSKNLNGDSPKS